MAAVLTVERGTGTLQAGGTIHTNSARVAFAYHYYERGSVSRADLACPPRFCFSGRGSFDVEAYQ